MTVALLAEYECAYLVIETRNRIANDATAPHWPVYPVEPAVNAIDAARIAARTPTLDAIARSRGVADGVRHG